MPNTFLQPSGLNTQFIGEGLTFSNYIATMQQLISEARKDIDSNNATKILAANSPYECLPNINSGKNGILLIHGLYDSPFTLKDLNDSLCHQGLLVRSILLPGHGTIPGDLLHIHYEDWIKAVNYGVKSLAKEVENIYLLGFSLGGMLAIQQAYSNPAIKGLILIAPVLKIIRKFAPFAKYYPLVAWMHESLNWYQIRPQTSYAKYESYPWNGAAQIFEYVKKMRASCKQALSIPLLMVLTADDETICYKTALEFFQQQTHLNSRLILYSNNHERFSDQRIMIRKSALPAENILNFSHTCLSISPQNSHFGKQGDYSSTNHAKCYGATLHEKNGMHRLSYNPDFDWMTNQISEFLNTVL
jgi:esterase/lipase